MKVEDTKLDGVKIITPQVFEDDRGFFFESYSKKKFEENNLHYDFVQDNHSKSVKGTLRGLHFQTDPGQVKLVRVTKGSVFDVAVDLRKDSPTFGQWVGVELTEENKKQLLIPLGFAHGFCVLSEIAEFQYKCTDFYKPDKEGGIKFDDPDIGIDWPIKDNLLLSERDQSHPSLKEFIESKGGL